MIYTALRILVLEALKQCIDEVKSSESWGLLASPGEVGSCEVVP